MGGDHTRFTFKAEKNYSGVLKQQGRVSLDADWNEAVEIDDRRWRSETIDIIGYCVVPAVTPDAFRVTPTGPGTFSIGIGRCYVDGLQAECHGLDLQRYDRHLGELKGTTEVPYADQPFYPAPLPPELSPAVDRTDLIYLDVWQREVTAIEDPAIQEIALGGPDTATRVQTVWQVRALEGVGDIDCADAIDEWDTLVEPSAGRLTSTAVAPAPSDDPCIISPAGGYRGLENRLYRVEIHTPGPLGTAEFKWSRDNGSIVAKVEAITDAGTTSQVTVHQLGRDQVLRFNVGDWVEILDDHREFQGLPGHIGKIANIDEANRILEVEPAIPASMDFDPADSERHTRVRRWDQKGTVVDADNNVIVDLDAPGSTGLIPVSAAGVLVVLEDGVQVQFDIAPANPAGEFKIGDYWVFAARTADGSVEELEAAPPRGIEHHYCRLALVTWAEDVESTRVRDCRRLWPPAHCCVSVRPGEDIQAAIDGLPPEGGCICLMPGLHEIQRPLMIEDRKNVTLTGVGGASKLVFAPMAAAGVDENLAVLYIVGASHGITINNFLIHADALNNLIVIDEASQEVTIEDMRLVNGFTTTSANGAPRCMFLGDCAEVTVLSSRLVGTAGLVQGTRDMIGQVREALASLRSTLEVGAPAEGAGTNEEEQEPPFEHVPLMRLRIESSQFFCRRSIWLVDVMGGGIKGNRFHQEIMDSQIEEGFDRAAQPAESGEAALPSFYEVLDEHLAALPFARPEMVDEFYFYGAAIYSRMLADVVIEDNTLVYGSVVIGLTRQVCISGNAIKAVAEGVRLGYSFDTSVDKNDILVLGEEKEQSGDDDPLAGYFSGRERTGWLGIEAQFAKGLRVRKNTIDAPTGIGNNTNGSKRRPGVYPSAWVEDDTYMSSVLRLFGIERLWRISVELAWFLYQLILFVLAVTGNAVTEPMTKEALGRYMYGWLATFLTGPYVPYFIGKAVVADNRMTVRHFGVYFYKILTVGGLRIHRNRVSGFDNTGILVHPWYSVGLADAHARFLRCAILNFIIFLTLLRDALAEYLEGEEPTEQPATEAGIVGYLALGVSWIVMLCARYCGGAAEEPGGDAGEQPPSPAEVLKDALDDFLDHFDPAWVDDLVNQSYEIDKNVVAGVGDGIYTGIDGSRISKNRVTLWPATTVPYETVVFGVLLPRHFDAGGADVSYFTDELQALTAGAIELDRDYLLTDGAEVYQWPQAFLDDEAFLTLLRGFLGDWLKYVDPSSPLSGSIDEMQAGLDPSNPSQSRVLAGWQAMIEVLVRAQRGYGIVMRGANMVCKGNKVESKSGCGGASDQKRAAGAVGRVEMPVSVAVLRQQTPPDIPAIGGIWQYTNFLGWLIDFSEFGFQDREFAELDFRDSDSKSYLYRLLMWLIAFLFLSQERERGLHIAQNEITRSLVHGIRTLPVMQGKELEIYDNTVRDVSRHGIVHYGWLEDEMNIKVHRNTLTKASGSSVFSRLGGLDDGFASLAQVFNYDGTTLMSHNSGKDKTSKEQGRAIYVFSRVVSITSNHVMTDAGWAFQIPSYDFQLTRGLFTDNVTNKPNNVPETIVHEPNIILTP